VGVIRYAITGSDDHLGDAERWAAEDINFVQLRAKELSAGELTTLARTILRELNSQTQLLVNGRVDVAVAVGAAGVHLTSHPEELTPNQVRQIFASANAGVPIISTSCHTIADVERARDTGADLILFGPVFEKRVAGEIVVDGFGLKMLQQACERAGSVKVLALGGVTMENAPQCMNTGTAGIAGIRLFARN
jgi:thiamine-phosphate pyrophosphorylase